jgi:hypothetical protein
MSFLTVDMLTLDSIYSLHRIHFMEIQENIFNFLETYHHRFSQVLYIRKCKVFPVLN